MTDPTAVWLLEAASGTGEAEISRLAFRQHGCAHRGQLEAAGLSRKAIARRVRSQRYVRLHSDSFLVRPTQADQWTASMAAALQCRGFGVLSGLSAGWIWKIWGEQEPAPAEVTLVGAKLGRPRGLLVHRVAALAAGEVRRRHGIPLTSPARTLLDLAAVLQPLELEAALASARRQRLVRDAELRRTLESAPPRSRGIARLRDLLGSAAATRDTRSVYERKLLDLIDLAQLPRPVTNVKVAGHMVDILWPEAGLVVEFDSWTFHSGRRAFETDRLRDQDLAVHGLRALRVTAHQIDRESYATVARLSGALAALRRA